MYLEVFFFFLSFSFLFYIFEQTYFRCFGNNYEVFIWRRANPLGRASPSKKAGFYFACVREFSGPSREVRTFAQEYINFVALVGGPALLNIFT